MLTENGIRRVELTRFRVQPHRCTRWFVRAAFFRPLLAFACALVARIPTVTQSNEIVVRYCQGSRESPQTLEEEPERAEPHPAKGEAQEGGQRCLVAQGVR